LLTPASPAAASENTTGRPICTHRHQLSHRRSPAASIIR
jgi:hypothetical protein